MHGQLNLHDFHVDNRQASDMTKPQDVCVGTAVAHDPLISHNIIAVLIKPLG
jgi:hypothetical protein